MSFPCRREQRLPDEDVVVENGLLHAVEHGFPRVVEQELSHAEDGVERGLPPAVERVLPCVVEPGEEVTVDSSVTVVSSVPCLGADTEPRRPT
ncbi:hypothetical protein F442_20758, partial [Phytophthora nicotianae P10297]